ncbi:hypothetical protein LDENG_00112550, partial [Lucifuga dentata]
MSANVSYGNQLFIGIGRWIIFGKSQEYYENIQKNKQFAKQINLMEQHQGVSLFTGFFKNLNLQVKIGGSAYTQ